MLPEARAENFAAGIKYRISCRPTDRPLLCSDPGQPPGPDCWSRGPPNFLSEAPRPSHSLCASDRRRAQDMGRLIGLNHWRWPSGPPQPARRAAGPPAVVVTSRTVGPSPVVCPTSHSRPARPGGCSAGAPGAARLPLPRQDDSVTTAGPGRRGDSQAELRLSLGRAPGGDGSRRRPRASGGGQSRPQAGTVRHCQGSLRD